MLVNEEERNYTASVTPKETKKCRELKKCMESKKSTKTKKCIESKKCTETKKCRTNNDNKSLCRYYADTKTSDANDAGSATRNDVSSYDNGESLSTITDCYVGDHTTIGADNNWDLTTNDDKDGTDCAADAHIHENTLHGTTKSGMKIGTKDNMTMRTLGNTIHPYTVAPVAEETDDHPTDIAQTSSGSVFRNLCDHANYKADGSCSTVIVDNRETTNNLSSTIVTTPNSVTDRFPDFWGGGD